MCARMNVINDPLCKIVSDTLGKYGVYDERSGIWIK